MVDKMTKMGNIAKHTVKVPEECKCGAIVKLPKQEDL